MQKPHISKTNGRSRGVIHHLPYRTRYRLSARHRNIRTAKQIHDSVSSLPGIKKVEVNERTGSILIHHEEKPEILSALEKALDSVATDLFIDTVAGEEIAIVSSIPLVAGGIKSVFGQFNNYFAHMTRNYLDLKTLLPLLFLGGGLYKASRERNWWEQMPTWVFFYYAFDTYMKFHSSYYQSPQIAGNGQDGPAH